MDFSNELLQSQFKENYQVNANTDTHGYGISYIERTPVPKAWETCPALWLVCPSHQQFPLVPGGYHLLGTFQQGTDLFVPWFCSLGNRIH